MLEALGFCGNDCSAGCDSGSIRSRRPPDFDEVRSLDDEDFAMIETAAKDGDVHDGHASLLRPPVRCDAPPSPGSSPRRCEACGMSFSAAAFEAHRSHCAKVSARRDEVLILKAMQRHRVDG